MKILWVTNMILPQIAERFGARATVKEGWVSGIFNELIKKNDENISLAVAFPVDLQHDGLSVESNNVMFCGFYENTAAPEVYDEELEVRIESILDKVKPDVCHIFGTEYPHTLATLRAVAKSGSISLSNVLVGIQGCMGPLSEHYTDGLPKKTVNSCTFRDYLKKDSIRLQKEKFAKRADNEKKALLLCRNVTGRTPFDRDYVMSVNPDLEYYVMNETLRGTFYDGEWEYDKAVRHLILLSQANYPIKGAHYLLEAIPKLIEKFPDLSIRIMGDNISRYSSVKDKIKISGYGKYLYRQSRAYADRIVWTGPLSPEEVKKELLNSDLFLCCSTMENSSNSLGEAMLLKVPCVAADVGGIPGIFDGGSDGVLYEAGNVDKMTDAIEFMWINRPFSNKCCENAGKHARMTHDPNKNFNTLFEIYRKLTK